MIGSTFCSGSQETYLWPAYKEIRLGLWLIYIFLEGKGMFKVSESLWVGFSGLSGPTERKERKEEEESMWVTCTMATCKRTPRRPTAMEATAITAGPVRNLTAIAKAAVELPHAMILGCNAMNNPAPSSHPQNPTSQLTSHNSQEKTFHQIIRPT